VGLAHLHTEHSHECYDQLRRRVVGRLMPNLASVVSVSGEIAEWRSTTFGDAPRVIPNGVSLPSELGPEPQRRARRRLGLAADRYVVGCVGRLSPEKEHIALVDAFRGLVDSFPESLLVLVGEGPERARIQARIQALELEGSVFLLGERDDLDELLPAFDVVALASRREGLPLALLEGMAHGKPVVATAVGDVPDLLSDGGGRAVPPGRRDLLAQALAYYADDREARRRDGALGRRRVERCHSVDAMVEAYVDEYRRALSRRRS
jgi:glycosyltransferase involved in cell wall biosynthesis